MPGIMSDSDLLMLGGGLGGSSIRRDSASLGQQSLLSAMNNFVSAVDEMDAAVMIPCKLQDMSPAVNALVTSTPGNNVNGGSNNGVHNKTLLPAPTAAKSADMYTYYSMLNAIKSELVQGPPKDESEGENDSDEIAQQTAAAFRHHLRGLFDVLRQMTSTAEHLTSTYKAEVGDTSTEFTSQSRSLSHFSL